MKSTYLLDHGLANPITQELEAPVDLCTAGGALNPQAVGWSRHPLHRCNLSGRPGRKKRWDYWCVLGEQIAFSMTIAHIDYLALGSVYLLEYETGRFAEKSAMAPFSQKITMTETVGGKHLFLRGGLEIEMLESPDGMVLRARGKNLAGRPFDAEFEVQRPKAHESLNVVIPWNDKTFQFTSKQAALPAMGKVNWGDETFSLEKGSSFAVLDFGRGIWPYSTSWNWAACSGRVGEDIVGINMGAKWTDGTGANENGIIVNGTLHKLFEDVEFTYDTGDFTAPWTMRTETTDAIHLTFMPFFDRVAASNLGILATSVHQCFGRYTGTVRAGGKEIEIRNLLGWAEEHHARW